MRLSKRSTYGVRAMYDLALRCDDGPISVLSISKREGISVQYLEQLLNKLKKEGLVKSIRGPKGGYLLAKKPKDIKIGDIVRNLERDIVPVNCVSIDTKAHCKKIDYCTTKFLWADLKESIDNVLDSTTLKDLVGKNNKSSR